ncbi:hypothetical protein KPL70_015374 [Citrus sinensis]|nr:hypothetical protein KPL70_015374 [Citrus sinensis]
MVEGETSRIGERSTETISGDTSGGRRDLSNRYSAPVIGGQKIDVEKFDEKINFGMWRREVMDALIQIDLDIRSCLTKEVKYLVKDEECAVTLWRTLEEKYLLKSLENCLHAMSQVHGFQMKFGVSMHDHVSRFEKLLADLKNLDEDIKDEVKAMILLHSLPEEYSHFVTTLIYGKSVIVFKDVCTALTSLEIRNNDKNSERASSEALVSRDWAMEKQKKCGGKNYRSKSRSRNIARDECAFCHEKGHWRKDCPKAQKRDGKKPAAANMARKDEGSDYSLSITPAAYVASSSEWILDTRATYHLCPIKEWFTNFRNLKSGAVVMGNDQPCRTMGIGTIRLKIIDEMVRELKEVRFVPALKKNLIYVGALKAKGYKVTIEDSIMKFTYGAMVILRVWVYTMRAEDEILEIFVKWKKLVETQTGRKIKNGVAERMNRTLLEKVRCMLSNAGLDKKFWAEAVSYASHLINRLPSTAIGGGVKGFKLWDLEDKKFVCSRDVTFDEASMMKALSSQQMENKSKKVLQQVEFDATPYVPVSSTSKKGSTMEVTHRVDEDVVSSDVPQNEETIYDVDNDDFIATRRPRREIKKLGWLTKDMVVAYALLVIDNDIFNTFGEALRNSESDQWKLAMEEEMKSLHQNLTWELVKLLKGKRAIGKNGSTPKSKDLRINQLLDTRVAGKKNHVCRLIKSLYGLKQSPMQWYKRFDQFIQGQKYTRSEHNHCVYFRRLPDGVFIYLLLYVDDMLIASKNGDEIKRLKKQLTSEFEMKDLGDAQRILGMEIRRDKKNGSVWLTQKSYLKKVLEKFGMDDKTKPVCTPLAPHFKLSSSSCPTSQEERDYMARVPYASAVGSLMYAVVCTRPDISQAVSMVSRYMHNPGKNHWLAVKWILRYLYGTVDVTLLFKKDCGQQCVGYCDSDFTGDLDKRRSTTGYVFTLGGGPVCWRSILQSTIALSSTEAEYMAATEAVKEAIWLRGLLGDFGIIQKNIKVFCDNQSAIFLAKNQTSFDYVEAFPWETGTTAGLIPTFGYVGSQIDAANVDPFEDHVRDEVWRIIVNRLRFG